METSFDRLHAGARRIPALHRLAVISRILLALAFMVHRLEEAADRGVRAHQRESLAE